MLHITSSLGPERRSRGRRVTQFLINVLMLGGIYGIVAAGFSLVYGVMNILNVAHGAFVMLGAYITFSIVTGLGLDPLLSAPVAALALFCLGYILQRYVLHILSSASIFMVFIFTFGLDMALQNSAVLVWSPVYRSVPSPYRGSVLSIGETYIPMGSLIVFVSAWLLAGLLFLLLKRTKLGLAIQATALDSESANLAGVDIRFVFAATFAIAAGLAGAAGALLSIVVPLHPFMGTLLIGKAFATAVLGGLGSVPGAITAGLILALGEVSAAHFLGARFAQLVPYVVLVLILVLRPRGLFGREYFAEVRV